MTPERLASYRAAVKHAVEDPLYVSRFAQVADDLLAHIDAQDAQIAALRRGQGPAPVAREPGPINVTPIPDSRRTP
jgi:hypothetical protein